MCIINLGYFIENEEVWFGGDFGADENGGLGVAMSEVLSLWWIWDK
jgi:hypothetical protein